MTTTQQLQNELNEMMARMKAVKAANTVECNAPTIKRSFSYRKSPAIKAQDLAL